MPASVALDISNVAMTGLLSYLFGTRAIEHCLSYEACAQGLASEAFRVDADCREAAFHYVIDYLWADRGSPDTTASMH